MPNQRVQYGGLPLFAGIFRGDDEVSTGPVTIQHTAVHVDGDDVVIDSHNQGTVQIKHDFGAGGQDAIVAQDKTTGQTTFRVDAQGDMFVRNKVTCESLETETLETAAVSGVAFSHEDNHLVAAAATVVQRDPTDGAVHIANLRCSARKTNLDGDGNAPDGGPPGLFWTEATCSDSLNLVDNAEIKFQPEDHTSYGFGCLGSTPNKAIDGLHLSSGLGTSQNRVLLRVSPDVPAISVKKTGNADVDLLQFSGAGDTTMFRVMQDGTLLNTEVHTNELLVAESLRVPNSAEDENGNVFDVSAAGNVYCQDIECQDFEAASVSTPSLVVNGDTESAYLELKPAQESDSRQRIMVGRNHAKERTFTLYDNGEMRFRHNFAGAGAPASLQSSILVQDRSLYVGSARISYDRSNHLLTLHRLKEDHIPTYLNGRGFVTGDLPSGLQHSDMSVQDWLVHARDHFADEHLDVTDVFPSTNTGDWVIIDSPVPSMQTDVSTLQSFATGADADITSLESEMDQAQADITALDSDVNQAQADITALDSEMNQAQADITALQAAGGGLGSQETIESASGSANLTIKSSQAADADDRVSLKFWLDRNTANEQEYTFVNGGQSQKKDLIFTATQAANSGQAAERECMRFLATGHVLIAGGLTTGTQYGGYGASGRGFRCLPTARFWGLTDFEGGATFPGGITGGISLVGDLNVAGLTNISGAVNVGDSSTSVSLKVNDVDVVDLANGALTASVANAVAIAAFPAAPQLSEWKTSNKADNEQLAAGSHRIYCGNGGSGESAQTHRFYLPLAPTVGDCIYVHALARIEFKLAPSVAGAQVYIAAHDGVNSSASKKILYLPGTHGTIRYSTFSANRWISDTGSLS